MTHLEFLKLFSKQPKSFSLKNILFILIAAITFLKCSVETKKEDIEVKLISRTHNSICISIRNNTKRKIYIPEIQYVGFGVKILSLGDKKDTTDITNKVRYALSHYDAKLFKKLSECCNKTKYVEYLSQSERDSIASKIVDGIKDKDVHILARIKARASRNLTTLIFIEPGESFNDYLYLCEDIKYDRISACYSYPYKHPIVTYAQPDTTSAEQIKYHIKVLDTLRFEYPKNIKGYQLYDKVMQSKPIIIDRN